MSDEREIVDGWLRDVQVLRGLTGGDRRPAVMVADEVERLRAEVAEMKAWIRERVQSDARDVVSRYRTPARGQNETNGGE